MLDALALQAELEGACLALDTLLQKLEQKAGDEQRTTVEPAVEREDLAREGQELEGFLLSILREALREDSDDAETDLGGTVWFENS